MSPALPLLADRKAEKERFSRMLAAKPQTGKVVIPHAVLVKRYGDRWRSCARRSITETFATRRLVS